METCKSNKQLQAEVREELASEPSVDSDAIGITADHGFIFLSGRLLGVTQGLWAEEVALRVDGVRAVIAEITIRSGPCGSHDTNLAYVATDTLRQLIGLANGQVKVIVRNGKVRLVGVVSSTDEKDLIVATVRSAIERADDEKKSHNPAPSMETTSPGPDVVLGRLIRIARPLVPGVAARHQARKDTPCFEAS
jgi:hypothetical protein